MPVPFAGASLVINVTGWPAALIWSKLMPPPMETEMPCVALIVTAVESK